MLQRIRLFTRYNQYDYTIMKMNSCSFVVIFFLSFICLLTAFLQRKVLAGEKMRVAIIDFAAYNLPESYARVTRSNIEVMIHRSGKFDVLERKMIEPVMEEQKGGLNCADIFCAIQVGKLVSADYVILGSVNVTDSYEITIHVVDINMGKIAFTCSETGGSLDTIGDEIVDKIVKKFVDIGETAGSTISMTFPETERFSIPAVFPEMAGFVDIGETAGSTISMPIPEKSFFALDSYDYSCYLMGGYARPVWDFAEIVDDSGYSFLLSGRIENIFVGNLFFGFESGCLRFPGKKDGEYALIIPFVIKCGYSFKFFDVISLAPVFSFGFSYNSYKESGFVSGGLEPVFMGGLFIDYRFFGRYGIRLGGEYSAAMEREGGMSYLNITAGAGVFF
ncbi:MAG: hypothetical protein GY754_35740 [bacterium]|nr:hypothetical protein [bacterium]